MTKVGGAARLAEWNGHRGAVLTSANGFDVIDCEQCEFKHIVAVPTEEELEKSYRHDYYTQEKPLYIERYRQDLDWWNIVYSRRFETLERHLPASRRRLLDIGSGPGFFLLNGKNRGWSVKGIEPSVQAADHSRGLGLDIENSFFSTQTAGRLGLFDAINMSEVLEHIPNPAALLRLVHRQLSPSGMVCIVVPNDFNAFQLVLRDHLSYKPWWVAPPHHVNYFDFVSLSKLVEKQGFEVVHQEATFPIDLFLLMGDNYVGNDALGRACHSKRMNFEMALAKSGFGDVLSGLYSALAQQGLGREVVLFARKRS